MVRIAAGTAVVVGIAAGAVGVVAGVAADAIVVVSEVVSIVIVAAALFQVISRDLRKDVLKLSQHKSFSRTKNRETMVFKTLGGAVAEWYKALRD